MTNPYHRATAGLDRASDLPLLIARVTVGLLFIDHGLGKYHMKGGLKSFEFFLKALKNIPLTGLTSQVVAPLEIVGGVLLIIGLLTRLAALLLAGEMAITGFVVKLHDLHTGVVNPTGAGAEVDFVYGALLLVILLMGPGRASIDGILRLERRSDGSSALLRSPGRVSAGSSSL